MSIATCKMKYWLIITFSNDSGRNTNFSRGLLVFWSVYVGPKAKNILIFWASCGIDENAMKPGKENIKPNLSSDFLQTLSLVQLSLHPDS